MKVLWSEYRVSDQTGELTRFDTKGEARDFIRRSIKAAIGYKGLYIDRIDVLNSTDQYGDLIRVAFPVD